MIRKVKIYNIKRNLNIVSLFLFSSNFLNLGHIFLVISFILSIIPSFRIVTNKLMQTFMIYILFFTIGYIMNFGIKFNYIIQYFIYPLMGAIIGQNVVASTEKKYRAQFTLFLAIILGLFFHGILNSIKHINTGNYLIHTEYLIDIWTKNKQSRISQGLFTTPVAILLLLSVQNRSQFINKLLIVFAVLSLYYSILIGNRSIFFIVFIGNFILLVLSGGIKEKLASVFSIIFIFVLFVILYSSNVFNLKNIIESSYFYERIFLIEDSPLSTPRFQYYILFIKNSGNYMLGQNFSNYDFTLMPKYIHNNWLDTFYYTGFIPFIFFSWFTWILFKNLLVTVIGQSCYFSKFKFLVIFAFLLQFMTEPIFQINPYYLVMFYILIFSQSTFAGSKHISNNHEGVVL